MRYILLFMILSGCMANTNIIPYSRPEPKIVEDIVESYNGDLPYLEMADARYLGEVVSSGNGFASRGYVTNSAKNKAASYGCTHLVYQDMNQSYFDVTLQDAKCTSKINSNYQRNYATVETTCKPPTTAKVSTWSGSWLCYRVDTKNWCKLPHHLRPSKTYCK